MLNDERYWNINLLNKWFAISSIVFMGSFIWMFIDDNDDEFKKYQRSFRILEIENSKKKLQLKRFASAIGSKIVIFFLSTDNNPELRNSPNNRVMVTLVEPINSPILSCVNLKGNWHQSPHLLPKRFTRRASNA